MNNRNKTVRTANLLAGTVGLAIAILLPLGYYIISYRYTIGSLETEVEINSRLFSQLINKNPEFWQFEQMRLEELLERRPGSGEKEIRSVINLQNEMVAESADPLRPPLIMRSYPLKDSGVIAGRIEIKRSMLPILARSGLIACLGVLTGLVLFIAMRILPFQAIIEAENALRESKERFRLLLKNANDAVYVQEAAADGNGKFIEVNDQACRMLGFRREELLCMTIGDICVPEQREKMQSIVQDLDKTGSCLFETEHLTKDDRRIPVEVSARLLELLGKPIVLSLVRDTSERKRLEAEHQNLQNQLHHAQKIESIGRLAGGVAHDLNNMLSVIIGNSELSLEAVKPGETLHENLQEVLDAAHRSREVTSQLLAFARKQTIAPKVLDLNDTVESMLKMLRRLIGEDIDLAWLPGPDLWQVKIDPAQIDQILANLCVNARDAIDGGGRISIETRNTVIDEIYCAKHAESKPGEYVMLAVSDDGCGMDKEALDNLFEPFFTTKGPGQGTGLGLSTVYGTVKQNDGYIDVYSEPGKGAVFKIYLPREPERLELQPRQVAPAAEKGTETILLVEDEQAVLRLVTTTLERYGYTVLTAESPATALTIVEQGDTQSNTQSNTRIDLLITDVVMPGMNGRQLEERIKQHLPNVKVLFMSGYAAHAISHHKILAGDVHFIQKPFSINAIAQKVREVLDQE